MTVSPTRGSDESSSSALDVSTSSTLDASLAAAVLDALPDSTAVLDRAGVIIAVNHAWVRFSANNDGPGAATGPGASYLEVCDAAAAAGSGEAAAAAAGIRQVLEGASAQFDLEYACPSPSLRRWFLLRVTPVQLREGGAVVSHVDITRRKLAELELSHLASHDPLTGLANRALFAAQVDAAMSRPSSAGGRGLGVLYVDLDGFKTVNDELGHDAGDELLTAVAQRLRQLVRDDDTVARLGGDEFAVCAPRVTTADLTALCERVESRLAEPYLVRGRIVFLGASVGAHLATAKASVADIVRAADLQMYARKRRRRTPYPRAGS